MGLPASNARRDFLGKVARSWLILTLLPALYVVVEYLFPPDEQEEHPQSIRVAGVSELSRGEGRIVRVGKSAIALAKTEDGQVRAFSALCTHLGCVIQYQAEHRVFHCNCHGSEFDLTGNNLSGPAPVPLKPRFVEIKKDEIFVTTS
jgi:cytochrome b6-f complex iron-sulfur subunit